MDVIILAAGYGTRLGDQTLNIPKPLLKVADKHIIDYAMDKLNGLPNIKSIYVVTNNKFYNDFSNWALSRPEDIILLNDGTNSPQERLGAVGDINYAVKTAGINDDVLVIAGDNLFEFSLVGFTNLFKESNRSIIAARQLPIADIAGKFGNIIVDSSNRIIGFEEKPKEPKSPLASTAIYLFHKEDLQEIRNCISELGTLDNLGTFISYLSKKKDVLVHIFTETWFDIGSVEGLNNANDYFNSKNLYIRK